jgi:uncharacterized protein (DUF58 family)
MTIQQIVARRLKLFSRRRVVSVLDGNYDSVFKGKGIELDSIRGYDQGDNIRDIDWRSTARTGTVQTKLYTPLRDQKIIVVPDSSASMLLPSGPLNKRESVYGLIVALGMFVRKNRDLLALCHGKPDGTTELSKFSNTNNHIEKLLRTYDEGMQRVNPANTAPLESLVQTVLHKVKNRAAVFVVSDAIPDPSNKSLLSRLSARHQVFWLQLQPSSPFVASIDPERTLRDVETLARIDADISLDASLQQQWQEQTLAALTAHRQVCRATGTAYGEISEIDALPAELRKMFLQARRYARRR